MANSKVKGGQYERDKSKEFSLWFSNNKDPNVFYRTGGSGNRGKLNEQGVYNQYGDMMALKEEGHRLLENCVFEFKKGYGKNNEKWDVLSIIEGDVKSTFKGFLEEAYEDSEKQFDVTGNKTWPVVVARRTRRKDIIAIPDSMFFKLDQVYDIDNFLSITTEDKDKGLEDTFVMRLEEFFNIVDPEFFKEMKL